MNKEFFFKSFFINKKQQVLFKKYINLLKRHNSHTNLVGKSTMEDPWVRHILDSIQISKFIKNKKLSILDMGSGAGLPGIIISIYGFKNVTLIDSNNKKINFLKLVKKEMNLNTKIILSRLEKINNLKFDIITSRALSNLEKLLSYSQKYLKKNTVLIFLKGKTVNEELVETRKKWEFEFCKRQSISNPSGSVLIIKNIKKK